MIVVTTTTEDTAETITTSTEVVVTTTEDTETITIITSTEVDIMITAAATKVDMIIATTTIMEIEDVIATLPPLTMTITTTTILTITIIMIIMVLSLMEEGIIRTNHITTKEDVVEDILDQTMVVTTDHTTTMEEIHTNILHPTIHHHHHTTQLHHTHPHTAPHHTIVMAIMVENLTSLNTKLKNIQAPLHMVMRVIQHHLIQVMKIDQLIMLHHTKIIILDLINCLSFLIVFIQIIFYIVLKHRLNLSRRRFFHKLIDSATKNLVIYI